MGVEVHGPCRGCNRTSRFHVADGAPMPGEMLCDKCRTALVNKVVPLPVARVLHASWWRRLLAWWRCKRLTVTHVRIPIPEFAGGGHVDIPRPIRNEFHQVEINGKVETVRVPVWAREVPMPERPDKRWM